MSPGRNRPPSSQTGSDGSDSGDEGPPKPTSPEDIMALAQDTPDIAPWDEPPSPPPKSASRFLPHKPSFSGFSLPGLRQPSIPSSLRHPRPSESSSTLSTEEQSLTIRLSTDGESTRSYPTITDTSTLTDTPTKKKNTTSAGSLRLPYSSRNGSVTPDQGDWGLETPTWSQGDTMSIAHDPEIAPWDEPPKTPSKSASRFLPHKPSFSAFPLSGLRQPSLASSLRHPRPSESSSTISTEEQSMTIRRSTDGESTRSYPTITETATLYSEPRQSKVSLSLISKLKKSRSIKSLRSIASSSDHPSLLPPPPSLPEALNFIPGRNKIKRSGEAPTTTKKKGSTNGAPRSNEGNNSVGMMLDIDTENMDGIIDLTLSRDPSISYAGRGSISSDGHTGTYSWSSMNNPSSSQFTLIAPSEFSNPFADGSSKRSGRYITPEDARRVSPKERTLADSAAKPLPLTPNGSGPGSPSWTAPESWAVEPGKKVVEPDYSSSDESINDPTAEPPMSFAPNPSADMDNMADHVMDDDDFLSPRLAKKAGGNRHKGKGQRQERIFVIRIYRDDRNQYHNVRLGPNTTVGALLPKLREQLLSVDEKEEHRLYLKERGRERLLMKTERPAEIVRKRLEQAGYDPTDCSELLGSEGQHSAYLLKFVFKSQLLRTREQDGEPEIDLEQSERIDLTGRGLRTIPAVLHQYADSIVSLKLSQNPMLEIPLDFIQSCTNLKDLRLSNMGMKKVPQSVRHATAVVRLDLSSNRISDLDEAVLDDLAGLRMLTMQNNRLERLPWYLPRLHELTTLNISNNKFRVFPAVVCDLIKLSDLDISFNLLTELPDSIGKLTTLERLCIVGNQISRLPDECVNLKALMRLDCRRNQIADLNIVSMLPRLQELEADHNAVLKLDLSIGPSLGQLNASYNEITQLSLSPGPLGRTPSALTHLDISHAKLSSLDNFALGQLRSLRELNINHNSFRSIPETLGELFLLEKFSCADNQLDSLPASLGRLQRLEHLDAHNNSLTELPVTLWGCGALKKLNLTSNLLGSWYEPPPPYDPSAMDVELLSQPSQILGRKTSATSLGSLPGPGRPAPPLTQSLECLYLGENQFNDDICGVILTFRQLRVLNLSFNRLQDLPTGFFQNMTFLEELYLSGNKLTSIPTENLKALNALCVVYLNGNRLVSLPEELGKVKNLMILDVGSNLLKYNVNNWEFDWNWNFNYNLRYLNLSGNNRLQIKPEPDRHRQSFSRKPPIRLAGFTDLKQLAVLGLMDVTIAATTDSSVVEIPDESDDRRVRTSSSTVLGMPYGIADAIGRKDPLTMLDLVHEFRDKGREGEAIFAMFGTSHPPKTLAPGATRNRLSRYLHDNCVSALKYHLKHLNNALNEGVADALRRTFLKLNQDLHDSMYVSMRKGSTNSLGARASTIPDPATIRSGISGIVVYFVHKTMYVANVGHAQAVVSRQGDARLLSRKHDPLDRTETGRIRSAEGWVSPAGLVNDEVDISRAFGYYHLLPVINARPDVFTYDITPHDEFVIIANRGLWDYMSYQTAVDIAREERADPMVAAQKLRDFAISYGADGSTMIMVIGVNEVRNVETDFTKKAKHQPMDRSLIRLENEVPPPVGHIALVFSDIRNSTALWEANPGMPTALRIHNNLLRRQLRFCGGYEVKTEGDAFMCSFPTATAAVWWAVTVQQQLLHAEWPLEILECEDGQPIYDPQGRLVARGLCIRMGIHCGTPSPELDPITHRMDYFGSMVNRSARICGSAAGGQIMCSADIIREINASVFETEAPTEHTKRQPEQAIQRIKSIGISVVPVGEVKLKGLEVPEYLSLLYPIELLGRQDWGPTGPTTSSGSRVPFSVEQMQALGLLCLRLEALTSSRIFRSLPARKGSIQTSLSTDDDFQNDEFNEDEERKQPIEIYGDPAILLPPITAQSTDVEMMSLLHSLAARIANAAAALAEVQNQKKATELQNKVGEFVDKGEVARKLEGCKELDERTLEYLLSVLSGI